MPEAASKAQSVADAVKTEAASQISSAASAVANYTRQVIQHIAVNCSVGTKRVCIGYKDGITCSRLPLNVSLLLMPEAYSTNASSTNASFPTNGLRQVVALAVDSLQPISDRLGQLSAHFDRMWMALSVLFWCLVLGFVYANYAMAASAEPGHPFSARIVLTVLLALGLACCSLMVALVTVLSRISAAAQKAPSWTRTNTGEVFGLCLGALGCTVAMTLLAVASAFVHKLDTRG